MTPAPTRLISLDEALIPLGEVPKEIPSRNGKKIHKATVWRWAKHGLAGVAPLETIRVGAVIHTSREALERFFERTTAAKDGHRHGDTPQAASQAAERANAELARAGL